MSKIILITGGARGLGKVIAQQLAFQGHIVYCASRHVDSVELDGIKYLRMDITSEVDCGRVMLEIINNEKRVDVIINNAGITMSGPTLNFSVDDFKSILDTNVIGAFRLLKALHLLNCKPSLIVNITSLNGFFSFPNFGLYSASKFAMEALGLALRYEIAASTKVVNVAIGALETEVVKTMPHKSAREKSILLKLLMPFTSDRYVSKVIGRLISSPSVPARVLIGMDTQIINILQKILPNFIFDKLVFYIWNKK